MTNAIARTGSAGLVRTLEQQRSVIAATSARGTDIDRLFGLVRATVASTDTLAVCLRTQEGMMSIVHATQKLAALGLEPTGREGGAYLVPFGGVVQVMPDWRTWVRRAVEQGLCDDIVPRPVHAHDEFEIWQDSRTGHEVVTHKFKPFPMAARGERLGWVVTILKEGSPPRYECIDMDAIAKRHAVSKGGSIWKQWGDEMERKTVIRMAIDARLPLGARKLADLFSLDDATTTIDVSPVRQSDPAPVVDLFGTQKQLPPADLDTDELISWAADELGSPEAAEALLVAHRAAHGGDVIYDDFTDEVLAAVGGA